MNWNVVVQVWMSSRWRRESGWGMAISCISDCSSACFISSSITIWAIFIFYHCLSLWRKIFKILAHPKNIRSTASNECFLFRKSNSLSICAFSSFPLIFLFNGVRLASLCEVCAILLSSSAPSSVLQHNDCDWLLSVLHCLVFHVHDFWLSPVIIKVLFKTLI